MSETGDMQFKFGMPRLPKEPVRMSSADAERVLLGRVEASKADPTAALWQLAKFYKQIGKPEKVVEVLGRMLGVVTDLEVRAQVVLALGQMAEAARDPVTAERRYREARGLEPMRTEVWYFIHNSLGVCLNQQGRHVEAERMCRDAIGIDPARANAHRNLGLSLEGQKRFEEAARAYVASTQADAADGRAFRHLEALLGSQPELASRFTKELRLCRVAVEYAAKQRATAIAAWKEKARSVSKGPPAGDPGTAGPPGGAPGSGPAPGAGTGESPGGGDDLPPTGLDPEPGLAD